MSGISERISTSLLDLKRGLHSKIPLFTDPISMTTDHQSNLLVVNNINYWASNFLVKFNLNTLESQPITGSFFFNSTNTQMVDGLSEVLNSPQGVCVAVVNYNLEKNVTLFISDTKNYRVLMVDVSTGISQTLVSKDSGIGTPVGIAYISNYVYFSDSEKHCLWRVNIRTRKLELFAGIPTVKGFNGDNTLLNTTFNSVSLKFLMFCNIYKLYSQKEFILTLLIKFYWLPTLEIIELDQFTWAVVHLLKW